MDELRTYKCCICGKTFRGYGNNPYPLVKDENARCCDSCNDLVILKRIQDLAIKKGEENGNK